MRRYELCGEEYIGDDVSIDVSITIGSMKHCRDALAEENVSHQYANMQITPCED